jgi:hypothetical protein
LPVAAQFHVEGAAAAMLGVRRLEAGHMGAEFRFMQPVGEETPQSALALGGVEMFSAMQSVTREGRSTLAGYDKDQAVSRGTLLRQESEQSMACQFCTNAVKVDPRIDLHLAAHQALAGAAIERRQWRRLGAFRAEHYAWRRHLKLCHGFRHRLHQLGGFARALVQWLQTARNLGP